MRTIKFRGKDYGTGQWVYGSLFRGVSPNDKKPYNIILTDEKYDAEGHLPKDIVLGFHADETFVVNAETVGQFTGLLDKNGKEIYEGDILKRIGRGIEMDKISYVEYFGSGFYFGILAPLSNYNDRMEIIGNIHDNPELLKGGTE